MRILLMDTCGETGSVALAENSAIAAEAILPERAASSSLLSSMRQLLERSGWALSALDGVGVVSGPGSFTGVRVGLAAAKGLCEARGLPLAAVSRLEVLAKAAGLTHGYAVLDAGRGELYVRRAGSANAWGEALYGTADLMEAALGERVVVAEERLLSSLAEINPELHILSAADALPLVLQSLQAGGDDLERMDANYVRSEQQIYGRQHRGDEPKTALAAVSPGQGE